jgi:hypothetical protein
MEKASEDVPPYCEETKADPVSKPTPEIVRLFAPAATPKVP